ncbi:MAG TPA: hypothetical protein VMW35_01465 [Myxococcota bacterium]|jgi:cell shape-determining protein MreD|nr:hypothetical protein [Myxococcota bacterium]
MITTLVVAVAGVLCLALQGALATFLPRLVVPDVAPLFAIALALQIGGARGLLGAAIVGMAADTLSGAPLGHLTLLNVVCYLGARAANASLELRSRVAQAALAAIWTPLAAGLTLFLAWWGGETARASLRLLQLVAAQTAVAAATAPLVGALVETLVGLTRIDEMGRRGAPVGAPRRSG